MDIYALPWGSRSFRNTLYEIARTKAHIEFKPRVFNDSFNDLVFYVDGMNPRGRMEGVLIQDERDKEKSQVILSKTAQLVPDPEKEEMILILQDGSIHIKDQKESFYRKIDFDYYHMRFNIGESLGGGRRIRIMDSEKSIRELKEKIKRKQACGENCTHEKVVINEKYAIPLCFYCFWASGNRPWGSTAEIWSILQSRQEPRHNHGILYLDDCHGDSRRERDIVATGGYLDPQHRLSVAGNLFSHPERP